MGDFAVVDFDHETSLYERVFRALTPYVETGKLVEASSAVLASMDSRLPPATIFREGVNCLARARWHANPAPEMTKEQMQLARDLLSGKA
jgi:hypothetical protein